MTLRVMAIDWSGAVSGAESKIWLAEVRDGQVVRLEPGRSRTGIAQHLIREAGNDPELVVGLDFAFSLPGWFLRSRGLADAPALWELVEVEGERWLRECTSPFWGRPGSIRPELEEHFRRTELEVPAVEGIRPKSVFQVGGAGAVGTGSLRGMPVLRQLRDGGFAIWPFDPVRLPLVVEIYPRALTGAVKKGAAVDRDAYLRRRFPDLPADVLSLGAASDDAFDALVSALLMWEHRDGLTASAADLSSHHMLEGRIWLPAGNSSSTRDRPTRAKVNAHPEQRSPGGAAPVTCPFCSRLREGVLGPSNQFAVALQDGFPVSPGHTLVVSREHEPDVLRLPAPAREGMWRLAHDVCDELRRTHSPDGFNLGVNVGAAAGQTVPHAHIHVIPRYRGDIDDPRGGIRWVLPASAKYW
jgi:diadenosine tetraphosphate (Ap4A) HIT family hydrolase